MKLAVHKSRVRLLVSLCAAACAIVVNIGVTDVPAMADSVPTLTVHVTAGSTANATGNPGGQLLPQNQTPDSAGPGFIYELTRLDSNLVNAVNGSQSERTKTVLSNPSAYVMANTQKILGRSDSNGTITNTNTTNEGSWVLGGKIQSGNVVGGIPAIFPGVASDPSYWLIKLVYHPAGLVMQSSENGLVALPYLYSDPAGGSSAPNFDVNVYPKTMACTQTNAPGGAVSVASRSMQSSLGASARVKNATWIVGGANVVNSADPTAFSACKVAPTPPAPQPKPATPIENIIKLARTGAGIQAIVLAIMALAILWLIIFLARNRKKQEQVTAVSGDHIDHTLGRE